MIFPKVQFYYLCIFARENLKPDSERHATGSEPASANPLQNPIENVA